MDLTRLIGELARPTAVPDAPAAVEVRQTHISAVFLAGGFAYKVKKPVALGFLDFSTPERRRHFCEEEVRLNRRLAPDVYLGVVPVTQTQAGLAFEGPGDPVEWAVKMRRLPDDATLLSRLGRGELTAGRLADLAGRLAAFHRTAAGGPAVAAGGRLAVVARNALENFQQSRPEVRTTVNPSVFERLRRLTGDALAELGPLIEARAARGGPRDTHGDLHLDHVYLFPDRPPPADLVVIDCIEFNERFRYADPVADAAFLAMDLAFRGRRDLAAAFADAYFEASGDAEGRRLMPFYTAYRAAVRAKVEGFELREPEIPAGERADALRRARGHWLLALGALEEPGRRPALVLVAGLPGTGKSTLARRLAERGGFTVVRSDEVRKEIASVIPAGEAIEGGIYSPEWTTRTYDECLRRAERELLDGRRVIVDANFREEERRAPFAELADRLAVPSLLAVCAADRDVVRDRLAGRRGDASDADWRVYEWAAARWQEPGPAWASRLVNVRTDQPDADPAEAVATRLRREGLLT